MLVRRGAGRACGLHPLSAAAQVPVEDCETEGEASDIRTRAQADADARTALDGDMILALNQPRVVLATRKTPLELHDQSLGRTATCFASAWPSSG